MYGVDWLFIELPKWKKSFNFKPLHKRDLWLTFLSDPSKLKNMYTKEEIDKFEELSEALDLINASQYTEAQIRGIEHYLDSMRYNNTLLDCTRKDTFKDVLSILHAFKSNCSLEEISAKYNVDVAYLLQLKEEITYQG